MIKIENTRYKVDELGNIYGLKDNILKPATDGSGYLRVGLRIDNKLQTKKVHRLVATAFIPNPENKPQVNHINCIKTDNRVENLEWVTPKENTAHAIKNGRFYFSDNLSAKNNIPKRGELNGMSKLTQVQVDEIRSLFKPRIVTRKILSEKYNVSEHCIKDIISKKSWK
jgi:hypothetical protein